MYQIGEWVIYGIHGVCRIIGTEKQLVNRKRTQYLVLEPLTQSEARFYLPSENPVAMAKLKPVLTKSQLEELFASDAVREDIWIPEENIRKQRYRELIGSGDRVSLVNMITSLYSYKEAQAVAGRKFHQADENFLRDAERLLVSEISLVLEISSDEARNYLRSQLKGE